MYIMAHPYKEMFYCYFKKNVDFYMLIREDLQIKKQFNW